MRFHSDADQLAGRAQSGDPMTGEAARHWRSATTVTAQQTAHEHGPAPRRQTLKQNGADGEPPAAVPARARPTARPRRRQWRYGPAIQHADEQPGRRPMANLNGY